MDEDKIIDKMFELGMTFAYFKGDFYGSNQFKVNANSLADLSERQYAILMALKYTDNKSLANLSKMLRSSSSNLSILISKLTGNGYVRKEYPDHREDKRKVYFHITPEGEEKLCQITERIETDFSFFYGCMDERQHQLLKKGINCFYHVFPISAEELLPREDTDEHRLVADQVLKLFVRAFNWGTHLFPNGFKVNGNDNRPLTDRQFGVLLHIHRLHCNTISKLEKVLPVEGSTLSNVISKLVRDGFLIRKHPDHGDGRIVYFAVTEKGEQVLLQVINDLQACLKNFVHTLDDEQRCNLILGLDNLNELFGSFQNRR